MLDKAAGYVIGKCVEDTASFDSAKVRECLAKWDRPTMYGNVKFNSGGQNTTMGYAVQIRYPKLEVVWPKEFATSNYVYPFTWKK